MKTTTLKKHHKSNPVLPRQNKSSQRHSYLDKSKHVAQSGFITLFFILGISFTFLTWISLSSERVFEYIRINNEFTENRSLLHNHTLCADAFINILLQARFNLNFQDNSHDFKRNLYFADDAQCKIKSIHLEYVDGKINKVFFIISDFAFEYKFKNGFVNFIKSFNLL